MNPSDPELIQACQAGNQAAWNQLVERYGRLIYSVPRRYGLSQSDADDVFAGVWATVFRNLGSLRDQSRLSAWLITCAHRESWRVSRQSTKARAIGAGGSESGGSVARIEDHFADVSSPPEAAIELWERQHLVHQAMERLDNRCRDLLTALFLDQASPNYEAVAKSLEMPLGSIGPTRARCFKKLQKVLLAMGFQPEDGELDADGSDAE